MKIPRLRIGDLEARYPVIQAGMGVRVGNAKLSAATTHAGGYGVISCVGLGDDFDRTYRDYVAISKRNLTAEIRMARELPGGKGPMGVNIMVVLTNYEDMVRVSTEEKIDFIISGAGLPLRLPEYTTENMPLIPVVSSGRALELILRTWKRKYNRTPAAVIIEGPLCGGHLAFNDEQLREPEKHSLDILFKDVKEVMSQHGLASIPVIGAGAVSMPEDVLKIIEMGYDGVQIGTRFICTEESGMSQAGKELYCRSTAKDIVVISSPVGMPVRVIKTPLVERVMSGKKEQFACPYKCLRTCDVHTVLFCIARALIYAWDGSIDNGLYMTGYDLDRVNEIIPVKKFMDDLEIAAKTYTSCVPTLKD